MLHPLVVGSSKCLHCFPHGSFTVDRVKLFFLSHSVILIIVADVRCTMTPLCCTAACSADLLDLVGSGKNLPLTYAALLSGASYLVGHSVDGQSGGSPSRHDAVHSQRLRLQAVGGGGLQ